MYRQKAVELAERLRPAFEETKLGIPLREVDFQTGQVYADVDNQNLSSLAEVASIQLECVGRHSAWFSGCSTLADAVYFFLPGSNTSHTSLATAIGGRLLSGL